MKLNLFLLLIVTLFAKATIAGEKKINPAPVLVIEGLGNGYGSPAIIPGRIFVTGEIGGTGFLFAYDFTGNLVWKSAYGREWADNFPGSRATPAISGSMVYTSSGMGDIACFDIKTGKKQWSVNMIDELHGENAVFGYSMPVLIENDRVYCLPGGPDTNIACLDKHTGKIIWTSKGNGETPGYAPPLFIRHHNRDLLVLFSELTMLGLDAGTGELLWKWDLSIKGDAPCNKPIYSEGCLYIVAGKGNGSVKFQLSEDGSQIKKIWDNQDFNTYFGSFVMIGNFLYGSSERKHAWLGVDAVTGRTAGTLPFGTGATASAGDGLILYAQSGKVGLLRPERGKLSLAEWFTVDKGTGEHFAHPVVSGDRLYIRHGEALLVYDYNLLTKP